MDKALAAVEKVALAGYDVILVNSSAGKDSQAMLDVIVEYATERGCRDKVIVVHADLGRVEWEGTKDLAGRQGDDCFHYPTKDLGACSINS